MQRKVALDDGLGELDAYFRRKGYAVLSADRLDQAVALIVSGSSDNFLGDQRRGTQVPVISAEGKTPEEIFDQVERAAQIKVP